MLRRRQLRRHAGPLVLAVGVLGQPQQRAQDLQQLAPGNVWPTEFDSRNGAADGVCYVATLKRSSTVFVFLVALSWLAATGDFGFQIRSQPLSTALKENRIFRRQYPAPPQQPHGRCGRDLSCRVTQQHLDRRATTRWLDFHRCLPSHRLRSSRPTAPGQSSSSHRRSGERGRDRDAGGWTEPHDGLLRIFR